MKESVENWTPEVTSEEIGEVISVGDEHRHRLRTGRMRPTVRFCVFPSGIKGMVQDLKPGEIGCILFGDAEEVSEGSIVRRTRQDGRHPGG